MAAINKSFVIKNGLEVNTNLIFADAPEGKVGIGTTNPEYLLHVKGGIGATDSFVSGISTTGVLHVGTAGTVITATAAGSVGLGITNPQYKLQVIGGIGVTDSFVTGVSTVLTTLRVGTGGTVLTVLGVGNSIGVGTASPQYLFHINSPVSTGQTALYVQGDVRITGDLSVDDITFDEASLTNLYVSGIGTIVNGFITNLTGTAGTITTFNSTSGTITNLTGTAGTITTLNSTSGTITNLNVTGISTLGTVKVSSGIITATSGIVTYFGDGNFLNLTSNPSRGIGIGTTGGVVGYAVTFINFKGAGVSTTQYNSSTGIATIFFEGGGGGGGGSGTPGGSQGQIQYNDSSTFAGSSNFTFDGNNVYVAGIVTATDFNSLSDINYKDNVETVNNALLKVEQLRGVSFDWKESGRSSYGVIAQELEEVLPELVKQGEVKSVNYNGIIGVLIEAIKELKKEVEEFKSAK